VRALIVRVTVIAAALAALVSGLLTMSGGGSWSLVALRVVIAFVLVSAVGFGVGLILMRTALRRHYERSRVSVDARRARGNR
jgi:predicted Abi (CAAX) family protease